jgi:hypothetical protein
MTSSLSEEKKRSKVYMRSKVRGFDSTLTASKNKLITDLSQKFLTVNSDHIIPEYMDATMHIKNS